MDKIGIIAVTYGQDWQLKCFINSIKSQTFINWDLHIYHDGKAPEKLRKDLIKNNYISENVFFYETEERMNQYGHNLRELGIQEQADKYDYLLITNCDNYYIPIAFEYIIEIFKEIQNTGVVYFDMVHSHERKESIPSGKYGYFNTNFIPCMCDIGSFVVKSSIAKKIGFPWRDHDADAKFIDEINKMNSSLQFEIIKILMILMVHN